MHYNPHRLKLDQLTVELGKARTEADALLQQCQRYKQFDVAHVREQAEAAATVLPERTKRLEGLQARLKEADRTVADLTQRASFGLNPLHWFSAERKRILQLRDAAIRSHAELTEAVKTAQASFKKAKAFSEQVKSALVWHADFDPVSAESRLQALTDRIHALEVECHALEAQCRFLDEELTPYLKDLEVAERRHAAAHVKLREAVKLETELELAGSGRERRHLHDRARQALGYSSPAEAIKVFRRDFEASDRDIQKLKRRLEQISTRHSRRIEKLVFDGMNLCFSRGAFIGVAPLKAVVRSLDRQVKMIFVFDGSIRKRGFDEAKLRASIGNDAIVHIVNGAADEVVLDLASNEHDYVVSNDNFIDYRTKPAVSERRIFKHERIDNRIMIPELGVSAVYA